MIRSVRGSPLLPSGLKQVQAQRRFAVRRRVPHARRIADGAAVQVVHPVVVFRERIGHAVQRERCAANPVGRTGRSATLDRWCLFRTIPVRRTPAARRRTGRCGRAFSGSGCAPPYVMIVADAPLRLSAGMHQSRCRPAGWHKQISPFSGSSFLLQLGLYSSYHIFGQNARDWGKIA